MEEKMFDLMSNIYGELSQFRNETDKRLNSLENSMNRMVGNMVCLENKLDNNSKVLFDGYKQTYEEVKELKFEVKDLSSKLDKQEVEIKVIKGSK